LFIPSVSFGQGWPWIVAALLAAWGMVYLLRRQERRQFAAPALGRPETRRLNPLASWNLLILAGIAGAIVLLAGAQPEIPRETRFGYRGGIVMMPEFLSLVVGLSMYNATYIGEIVRSGFTSIPRGQTEAADSLGLPRRLTVRLVLFPQALRVIIPPLTTVYLNLFKSTSLAAAIAYPEVVSVFVGTVNNLVGQPVFIMAITMAVYVFISLCIALFLNWYNSRIALTAAA
jgi:general L-amino acid transport system permease protein